MPLRCLDYNGRSIQAFDLSDDEWEALSKDDSQARHLRMPCCEALVTLKRSRLRTKFFAHKAVGDCKWAPETEEHLLLKRLAVETARASGWIAETEVMGETASGEFWKADVLAVKGNHKVVVEIQWSGQTALETLRRQERYRASGVRGLWLLRQPGFPISKRIPAACIGGSLEEGLTALLPRTENMQARDRRNYKRWHQVLPMKEFLRSAFDGRLRFGLYESDADWDDDPLGTFRVRIADGWKQVIYNCGWRDTWDVSS